MRPGTIIQLQDGRIGTTVFNGLIGIGIKWGEHTLPEGILDETSAEFTSNIPEDFEWEPDAILRNPWDGCDRYGFTKEQCVGDNFVVLRKGK